MMWISAHSQIVQVDLWNACSGNVGMRDHFKAKHTPGLMDTSYFCPVKIRFSTVISNNTEKGITFLPTGTGQRLKLKLMEQVKVYIQIQFYQYYGFFPGSSENSFSTDKCRT